MIDPRDEKPDRSAQYKQTNPAVLVDQLNENWRQLRLLRAAVSDRDEVIATLHGSIAERDKMIAAQETKMKLLNRVRPFVYATIGGAVTKMGELGFMYLFFRK